MKGPGKGWDSNGRESLHLRLGMAIQAMTDKNCMLYVNRSLCILIF